MVSTPENGVDSIALTYSLLDPIMTLIRPLAGFVTGVVAGLLEYARQKTDRINQVLPASNVGMVSLNSLNSQSSLSKLMRRPHLLATELLQGQKYAFGTLFNDIAPWYLMGIIVAGLVTYVLPDNIMETALGAGMLSYLTMLILGLPIYVCATFSTPIAAAMVAKGLSPGSALVFLLAGPATNLATITMLLGLMGRKSLYVYLFAIVVCSIGFAYLTDLIYYYFNIKASSNMHLSQDSFIPGWLETLAATVMIGLIVKSLLIRVPLFRKWRRKAR